MSTQSRTGLFSHRQDNPLHRALLLSHQLARVPTVLVLLALVGGALAQGLWWHWLTADAILALCSAAFYLAVALFDWVMLAGLPRWGKSYGPPAPPLLALSLVRWGLDAVLGAFAGPGLLLGVVLNSAISLVAGYATWVEPFRLGVTHLTWETDRLPAGAGLRLVQLADIHMERMTARDRAVLERVRDLAPDLILLTGDFINLSYVGEPTAMEHFRAWAGQLQARYGIYAVQGTPPVDPDHLMGPLFDGLPIRLLRDEHVSLALDDGTTLVIVGVGAGMTLDDDQARFQQTVARALAEGRPGLVLLLYHLPDLMPEAAAEGIDLYLAGHTHGGQIRLPLFGAVLTSSRHWKRYEMGLYRQDRTTLYVSRGLGMEGMAAPRARFLSPPEIVCIDVK
ncbi:MAG: metallophosphoesterase [Chloroflexi bacterium]|nr:metallophosphoesterase [Chloroflexota bacterium]MBU1879057.1 metallophosphoesterase [Chloroflexota bacterium]